MTTAHDEARLVACYDACAGIPTDQLQPGSVKALVEGLNAIVFQIIQGKVLERDACITQARAALAQFKGESG